MESHHTSRGIHLENGSRKLKSRDYNRREKKSEKKNVERRKRKKSRHEKIFPFQQTVVFQLWSHPSTDVRRWATHLHQISPFKGTAVIVLLKSSTLFLSFKNISLKKHQKQKKKNSPISLTCNIYGTRTFLVKSGSGWSFIFFQYLCSDYFMFFFLHVFPVYKRLFCKSSQTEIQIPQKCKQTEMAVVRFRLQRKTHHN